MTSTEAAIALNNQAIGWMQQGRMREAVSLLRSAVSVLRHSDPSPTLVATGSFTASVNLSLSTEQSESLRGSGTFKQDESNNAGALHTEMVERSSEITSHVLRVPGNKGDFCNSKEQTLLLFFDRVFEITEQGPAADAFVGAILIYNWAVIHHMKGCNTGASSCFNKALQLYALALEIIDGDADCQFRAMLTMAVLNNIACIHAIFFSFASMRGYLEHLKCLLCRYMAVLTSRSMAVDFEKMGLNHFALNAAICVEVGSLPAPAA